MTAALELLTGTARRRRIAGRLAGPRRPLFPLMRLLWRQHWVALSVLLTLTSIAVGALTLSEAFNRRFPVQEWRAGLWQAYGPNYPDLAMQAIPLAGALFVGVQLISRELEDGTASFAWTQGYSKARWALGKLAAAAAVLVPAAVALGLVFGWWYRLYVPVTGYFGMHAFAMYAPALAGWTIAGLTLGMAAASLTRRAGRAMGLTLAGWIALHHYAIVGSPRTRPAEFWPLQFAQLAILLAISALLTAVLIAMIQGAPAVPGMPRLLRRVPGPAVMDAQALARRLQGRRLLAVPRAACRQHRTGLLVALTVVGLYGATLVITGLHIHAEPARLRPRYSAGTAGGSYELAVLLPLLIGTFFGASLTGPDLDRGTVRFAWAQGVSRTRWALGKLAAVGCLLVAAATAVGLVFQWWNEPYLAVRLADPWFGLYAPVYAGWMAITLTAAFFLGALMRSRGGAAYVCFIGTYIAVGANDLLRVRYLPPAVAVNRPAPPGSLLVNWNISRDQTLPAAILNRMYQNFDNATGWTGIERSLAQHHATSLVIYQPASRFWQLQAIESAGLFALALLFAAAAVWVIRRRES